MEANFGGHTVRLWINKEELVDTNKDVRLGYIEELGKLITHLPFEKFVERAKEAIPGLNAMQVSTRVDADIKMGTVVYYVDFGDKDPHG